MKYTVKYPENDLIPIIQKYLDKLTTAQWAIMTVEELMTVRELDPDIQFILADMLCEIIQTVTAEILRVLLQQHQAAARPLETLTILLGDSLHKSFSQLFNVSLDQNEDMQELTDLVEKEIEGKVTNGITEVSSFEDTAPCCDFYVHGFVSIQRLDCMVLKAGRCLAAHLAELNLKCPPALVSARAAIDVPLAVERVTDILVKWSTKSYLFRPEDECSFVLPNDCLTETKEAATNIVKIFKNNLKCWKSNICCSSKISATTFNMGPVVTEVKNYFLPVKSEDCEEQFLNFARKQFDIMISDLNDGVEKKQDRFIFSKERPRYSHLNFDTIELDILDLFRFVKDSQDSSASDLRFISSHKHMEYLTKDLTLKLWKHRMPDCNYTLPLGQLGKTLSDSVVCKARSTLADGDIYPDMVYAIAEDGVGQFLRKVVLCLITGSDQTTDSENLAGALMDIESYFTNMLNSPKQGVFEDVTTVDTSHGEIQKLTADAVAPKLEEEMLSSSFEFIEESSPDVFVGKMLYSPPSKPKIVGDQLITALLIRLLKKYTKEKKTLAYLFRLGDIAERLSLIVTPEVENIYDNAIADENMKDLAHVLAEDLLKRFRSPMRVLQAAMAKDPSFDNAVLICLRYQLQIRKRQHKKGCFAKFFSMVQKSAERFVRNLVRNDEIQMQVQSSMFNTNQN